ncbi:hypothetical protein [Asticcacaulis solisilvae]|uniref:hypothetical protein n=1 Tax=Asticcacaulis solisilvae TaxID=1217274 RepID=UPI003FD8D341
MKYGILCLAAAALSAGAMAPQAYAFSQDNTQHYWACANSADWLTRHSTAYLNASTPRREQIMNQGGDAAAGATRALCRDLFLKTGQDTVTLERRCDSQIADNQRRFGDAVAEHNRRLNAFCAAALNAGHAAARS